MLIGKIVMRAIYKLPIKEPIVVEDQWPISVLDDGTFRLRIANGKITCFEIVFNDQPVDHGFLRATSRGVDRLVHALYS